MSRSKLSSETPTATHNCAGTRESSGDGGHLRCQPGSCSEDLSVPFRPSIAGQLLSKAKCRRPRRTAEGADFYPVVAVRSTSPAVRNVIDCPTAVRLPYPCNPPLRCSIDGLTRTIGSAPRGSHRHRRTVGQTRRKQAASRSSWLACARR